MKITLSNDIVWLSQTDLNVFLSHVLSNPLWYLDVNSDWKEFNIRIDSRNSRCLIYSNYVYINSISES